MPASTVQWNGSSRTTTFVSGSKLQAHIMAADLAAAGKVAVTAVNPAPGGGSSNAATFTVAANTIVFDSSRALDGSDATNGTFNIWKMNPDGTAAAPLTKLTAPNANCFGPLWSPDGSKVAFVSRRALDGSDAANSTVNLWVMNADGSGVTPLTKLTAMLAVSFSPIWSPDGSKIAFTSARALDGSDASSGSFNVWVMNADGSGATPLTKLTVNTVAAAFPAWSPDGSKLAYLSNGALDGSNAANTNGTSNVWTINADGSGATPLTKLSMANSKLPAWSPDGSKIAFYSNRALDGSDTANTNSTINVWVMNADGSGVTPLTKLTAARTDTAFPVWSPDGSKIAFNSARALDGSDAANTNFTANEWVMNADGSGATPLTKLTATGAGVTLGFNQVNFIAAWSPDGSKVIFQSRRALNGTDAVSPNFVLNIWTVNVDGSVAAPLTLLTATAADSEDPNQP